MTDETAQTNPGMIGDPMEIGPNGPHFGRSRVLAGFSIQVGLNPADVGNPPISLRLGELLTGEAARRRRWPDETLAAIIRRDLDRYYSAARETVLGFKFLREEAFVLVEALSGEKRRIPRFLWAVVDEWAKTAKHRPRLLPARADAALVAAILVPKLRECSALEAHAIYDAVDLFAIAMKSHGLFYAALASGLTFEVATETDADFGKQSGEIEQPKARVKGGIQKKGRVKK